MHLPAALQPIRRRLPLLMAIVPAVIVAALSWVAYRRLEQALISAGTARVTVASQRLAAMLDDAARRMRTDIQRSAADTAIRSFMTRRDSATGARLRSALERSLAGNSQNLGVLLRDSEGRVVLASGRTPTDGSPMPRAEPVDGAVPQAAWMSPILAIGDTTYFGIETPILASGDTVGSLTVFRRVSSATGAQAIGEFIGPQSRILLGNSRGGIWTDYVTNVEPPAADPEPGVPVSYAAPDGEEHIGVATAIPRTPWVVMASMPRRAMLDPGNRFLRETTSFAIIAIALGALVGWLVSRRMTQPLAEMAVAAEGITAGDYSRRVVMRRPDEFGRLATSFNTMAEKVEGGTRALEVAVAERTRELEVALAELRDTQETLLRRERLAILGQLAGGVGHELRNPLGVMTNALYYLDAVLGPDAPPTVREYVGILRTQVGLSERIVGDLLDYARIKPPRTEPVSLASVTDEQVERLGKPEGITIERDFPAELPDALIDRVQVGQVVFNLLTNAVQAMPEGGRLTLRGRHNGNGNVSLEVTDTGTGIPEEHMKKLFEPLFTTKARGIGLGLAVSRGLARANRGDITVRSRVGVGTTFSVILPVRPAESA